MRQHFIKNVYSGVSAATTISFTLFAQHSERRLHKMQIYIVPCLSVLLEIYQVIVHLLQYSNFHKLNQVFGICHGHFITNLKTFFSTSAPRGEQHTVLDGTKAHQD